MKKKALNEDADVLVLTDAVKRNDEVVLRRLYESNYHKIEKYVFKNNGCSDQAKDIYQEAFIIVWRNIKMDKFCPENENELSAYLFKIAKNKWIDHLRSQPFKKNIPINGLIYKISEESVDDEDNGFIENIKKNFEKLGKNCKELLTQLYYKKESMKIIAERFDWTDATARNNKYRCLQRLREMVKIQGH